MQADYVIVGAGSAGCVLANRLTEDPSARVILIEAGGRDWNPLIHIPAGFMKMLDHQTLTWGFKAEPDPGTDGREIIYPRGRVLGGSSLDQRADLYPRPTRGLRPLGAARQSRLVVGRLPALFQEGRALGGRATTKSTARTALSSPRRWTSSPICAKVIEAGMQLGLEYREDVNNLPPGAGDSIGWCQQTRGGRRRASTARTYLRPALKRPNLQVVTNALVHRVVFDGKRAVGVEFSRGGGVERVDAAREVILSAGAIGSPHLLQLSGVGDPEHLGRSRRAGACTRCPASAGTCRTITSSA